MERRPLEKRVAILILALFLTGVTVAPLCAQTYPSKPVRFILPFPAGGLTDVLGRIMAQKFADGLGQPVVPENRPGAGGTLGIEIVSIRKDRFLKKVDVGFGKTGCQSWPNKGKTQFIELFFLN